MAKEKISQEDKALERFADLMIQKLETIQADWKKPWFVNGASTSMPCNLNGRLYNGMNSFMLMLEAECKGYELPVWCTFDRAMLLNKSDKNETAGLVRIVKGEESFPVFITTWTYVHRETKEKIKHSDWQQLSEEERGKYQGCPRLQVYRVFNVAQTNIKEARPALYQKLLERYGPKTKPELNAGEEFVFPAMDFMISHNEWICPIKSVYGDDAYYSISKDEIVVPEKEQFKDGESFYANLAHEMAHSTGAGSRLNRLYPTSFGSREYAKEELVAELTAALTSQRYGMDKCIKEDSAAYLSCWLLSLKEEPSFIKTVLLDVKRAYDMVYGYIDMANCKMRQEAEKDIWVMPEQNL